MLKLGLTNYIIIFKFTFFSIGNYYPNQFNTFYKIYVTAKNMHVFNLFEDVQSLQGVSTVIRSILTPN